ncbi:protease inhibitor I42 family protein [Streptomyces sp. NBC_01294]|uniref:protease inhibitor I42 family protein n=1 Tax=Streptomyces sp. NBC_01294 TaxID=2903815 RepID=UPI002DD9E802|nr:protease inhibitor I42 family protein [Streptomyces sp. NBC_01294]WRZ58203.1 protease inhibitor I42 family protein [Streptomyces sp. NBC_01294]
MEVRSVVLSPGERYELRLTGRGARGYVWTWQVTGDTDVVTVTEGPSAVGVPDGVPGAPDASSASSAPSVPADPGDPGVALPGAPVERTYVVRARSPGGGRASIRFAQVRPPYPDEAPYDEFVLDVEVTSGTGGAA